MKRWISLAAVALVIFVGVGVYRAGLHEAPPPPPNQQVVLHGGSAHGQKISSKSWSVDYDRVVGNADQTVLDIDGVRHGIIYKAGKPYLRVKAAHMSVNMVSRDFTVVGPMHVETVGGAPPRSFDTTSAVWNDATQRLTLAQHINFHSGAKGPLSVGSLTFDVKRGDLVLNDVAGPVRFK